ncbi:endoglucanase [Fusarium longipes]|uniref:lytic cellulose monooxygenase (C4-dehydrogenating) n=1 Tax=Fusarium longipes TaxID=694270 RepID=A0A395T3Z0_9HYPO|nr:endoglucanase [Fusarium longipes]
MPSFIKTTSLLAISNLAVQIAAHGHVDWIITDGVAYRGYDAPAFSWNPSQFPVAGWITGATDNGYVEPNSFSDPDIICHRAARNARGHITVSAGDKINLKWNDWPSSHKGPVIDYLARCTGLCQDADKNDLEFFKISEAGLIDRSTDNGYWASDVLIGNGNSWTVQIPEDLASGNYVLRHEIIALHGAGQKNGAQNYPQCFNIKVVEGGNVAPEGIQGTELYKTDDAGILFNLYVPRSSLSYEIPGPTLVPGLPSTVQQRTTSATATSSATIPGQQATSSSSSTTTSKTTSSFSNSTTSSTSSSSKDTTLITTTTRKSSSSTSKQPSEPTDDIMCGPVHGLPKYSQCGGRNYVGDTICAWGATCQVVNEYYWQCL